MRNMKSCLLLGVLAGAAITFSVTDCARTISGRSCGEDESGKFFNAASEKDQAAYFERVRGHFQQIGRAMNDDQVKQHTAAVFILTVPPTADVYDDSGNFMGKTNGSQLYFTPGKHQLVFKKGAQESKKEVEFTPGKNMSIVVKF